MELQVQPKDFGIEEKQAEQLTKGLDVILAQRDCLKEDFLTVSSLEITEENIPTFKELRLKIRNNRTQGIEKWHKTNKEFFLTGGRFVDAIKNKESLVNTDMEDKLMEAEKHFENLERQRIENLNKDRKAKIEPYVQDLFGMDLGSMPEDVFNAYFESKKKEHEERLEAERKAELERIENERLDKVERDRRFELAPFAQFITENKDLRLMPDEDYKALKDSLIQAKKEYEAEQEKIRLDNERLKKEAEEKAKEIEKERQKAKKEADRLKAENEAKIKKEQEAKAKLEAELKAKKDAEIKAENDRKAAEEKAKKEAAELAKAPIKKQLTNWVSSFELPNTSIDNEKTKEIKDKFEAFKNWSKLQVNNL